VNYVGFSFISFRKNFNVCFFFQCVFFNNFLFFFKLNFLFSLFFLSVFVVGFPIFYNFFSNKLCKKIFTFSKLIFQLHNIDVFFISESVSTKNILDIFFISFFLKKKLTDELSAYIFLNSWFYFYNYSL
jgi:RNase H-fold protein (predicted Holliday junction resolvase)